MSRSLGAHLIALESEAIYILREVAAQLERPVLLFSGGKDSVVTTWLARRAFHPAPIPFPLLHIDTGHNFAETVAFRSHFAALMGCRLVVRRVQDSIDRGRARDEAGPFASRNALQTVTLLDALRELRCDAAVGGARRDEEKARAKERVFSHRNHLGEWDPRTSGPSCGTSTTAARGRMSTSACSRFRTGRSSTSGSTSATKRFRCRRCTSRIIAT